MRGAGGLAILGVLTLASLACSVLGWATGWPMVGGVGFAASLCGGAMIWRAKRQMYDWRGE
jgi:hypothetical protein